MAVCSVSRRIIQWIDLILYVWGISIILNMKQPWQASMRSRRCTSSVPLLLMSTLFRKCPNQPSDTVALQVCCSPDSSLIYRTRVVVTMGKPDREPVGKYRLDFREKHNQIA